MRSILAFAVAAVLSTVAVAQSAKSDQEHAAHHPPGASAAAPSSRAPSKATPKSAAKASAQTRTQLNTKMKSMQEMHDKMMAAKTPEERQALMGDHIKTMQDGMAALGQMKGAVGGGMSSSSDMMNHRMDMLEMMVQMMMDRESARTPAAK